MEANKVKTSHKPPSDGSMAKEEFIRVGTTLYKIVARTISAAFPSMTVSVLYPNTSAIAL